jgi:hypothetical protein
VNKIDHVMSLNNALFIALSRVLRRHLFIVMIKLRMYNIPSDLLYIVSDYWVGPDEFIALTWNR